MKTTCKVRRKKVFPALLLLLVLTVVLSVGTTFGKYHDIFPFLELDNGEYEVELQLYDVGEGGDPTASEAPGIAEETPTTVYQVQPGDTLAAIAEKFHTTADALIAYNQIENPDLLQPGTILRIPPADYVVPANGSTPQSAADPTP